MKTLERSDFTIFAIAAFSFLGESRVCVTVIIAENYTSDVVCCGANWTSPSGCLISCDLTAIFRKSIAIASTLQLSTIASQLVLVIMTYNTGLVCVWSVCLCREIHSIHPILKQQQWGHPSSIISSCSLPTHNESTDGRWVHWCLKVRKRLW